MKTHKTLFLMTLLAAGCVFSTACAGQLRCRYTALDAKHRPIKPHHAWVKGSEDACVTLIHGLQASNAPDTVGVEVKGPKAQRMHLHRRIFRQEQQIPRGQHISTIAEVR